VAQKGGIGGVRDLNSGRVQKYSALSSHLGKTGQMLVRYPFLWEHPMAEWLTLPRRIGNSQMAAVSGNIGIGTTKPGANLDVESQVQRSQP